MTDFSQTRTNMVDGQIHPSGVVDEEILKAFETMPRELFAPEKLRDVAYTDENLDLGQGRYLIEPIVHARLLQAVQPVPSDIALDIGSASGYSSAILSSLVTTVIAVEGNKRQMDKASKLWNTLGCCNVVQIEGDLAAGAQNHAPYSLIMINGAVGNVPQNILDQLDIGGRLAAIVKKPEDVVGQAMLYVNNESGHISSRVLFDANVPTLAAFETESIFQF